VFLPPVPLLYEDIFLLPTTFPEFNPLAIF
jgi:hypothetical protein